MVINIVFIASTRQFALIVIFPFSENNEDRSFVEDKEEESTAVEMNWDVVKYFPEEPPCQEYFNTVIATYISAIHDHLV